MSSRRKEPSEGSDGRPASRDSNPFPNITRMMQAESGIGILPRTTVATSARSSTPPPPPGINTNVNWNRGGKASGSPIMPSPTSKAMSSPITPSPTPGSSTNRVPILGDFLFLHSATGDRLPLSFPNVTDIIPIVTNKTVPSSDTYKAPPTAKFTISNPLIVRFDSKAVNEFSSPALKLSDVSKAANKLHRNIDDTFKRWNANAAKARSGSSRRPFIVIHDFGNDGSASSTESARAVSAVILAYLITVHNRTLRASLGRLFAGSSSADRTCVDVDRETLVWLKEREREMLDRPVGAGASVSEVELPEAASARIRAYVEKPVRDYESRLASLASSRTFAISDGGDTNGASQIPGMIGHAYRTAPIRSYVVLGSKREVIDGPWHRDSTWVPMSLTGAVGIGYIPSSQSRIRNINYSLKPVSFSSDPDDDPSCDPACARVDLIKAVYGTFNRLSDLYHSPDNSGLRKLIMVYDGTPDGHRACAVVVGWLILHKIDMRDALKIVGNAYHEGQAAGVGMPMLSRDMLEQLQSLELTVSKRRTRLSYPYFEIPADPGLRRALFAS